MFICYITMILFSEGVYVMDDALARLYKLFFLVIAMF